MPCTFSHPLAVVPLCRFCPQRLSFAALVIGSMSPDFGYYFRQFPLAHFAHTALGTLTVCLPSGLLAVALFYLLRRPLCFVLPQPHRAALMPLTARQPSFSFGGILAIAVSVLFGAWTHTAWDSLTHDGGWAVERLAVLRAPVIHNAATTLPISYVLQQASTFGAGALVAFLYFRWLRQQRTSATDTGASLSDRWRYLLIALLAFVALVIAIPAALRMASLFDGYLAFRVFFFRTGVYSVAVFVPLLIIFSIASYVVHRRMT